MPPTQKELAKYAGVSSGTVSNVINGAAGVSERSRRKVAEAIKALRYQPNLIARSLKTNKTNTLGMIVPDITVPFFAKVIRGAESAAREAGYFLTVLDSENNDTREASMMALLHSQRVEGMLLIAAGGQEWLRENRAPGFPIVCLDRLPADLEVDSVCVDDFRAAEMAISHLIQMGHTRIAIITGPLTLKNECERLRGAREALKHAGLILNSELVWEGGFDQKNVSRLCQAGLLRQKNRPTALFSTNGVTGLAALRSIYSAGMSVPADIACVVFDEIASEDFFRPAITSVVQPAHEIGYRAVEVLLKRINGSEANSPIEQVRLPATLIVRESSGKSVAAGKKRSDSSRHG